MMNAYYPVLFLLLAMLGACSSPEMPKQLSRPNIILIMADDLGYGDLGCYGQKTLLTPNIDRMAAEGMRFSECYAGNTVCMPSRSSLLTGLHPGHARHRGNYAPYQGAEAYIPFEPGTKTVASYLQAAGYRTGHVGKWHLGGQHKDATTPTFLGFDYSFSNYPNYLWTKEAKKEFQERDEELPYYFDHYWRNEERVVIEANLNKGGKVYCEETYTDEALSFIQNNRDTSFFLYLAYTSPHAPQVPYSEEPFADEDWPEVERKFAAEVFYLDHNVGKILDLLRELNIDENTLVLFTSDNGPHVEGGHDHQFFDSNGPLRGYKRDLYDGGIKVPMIARWPKKIQPGSTTDLITAFWDLLPTFCELAEAPVPEGIDGLSILPTLLGEADQQKKYDYLYWEMPDLGKQAVRMGKWKGVKLNINQEGFEAPVELYEVSTDVGEENDVAAQFPEVVRQIQAYMAEAHVPSPYFRFAVEEESGKTGRSGEQ